MPMLQSQMSDQERTVGMIAKDRQPIQSLEMTKLHRFLVRLREFKDTCQWNRLLAELGRYGYRIFGLVQRKILVRLHAEPVQAFLPELLLRVSGNDEGDAVAVKCYGNDIVGQQRIAEPSEMRRQGSIYPRRNHQRKHKPCR